MGAWERCSVASVPFVASVSSLKRWDSGTVAFVEGLKCNGALATVEKCAICNVDCIMERCLLVLLSLDVRKPPRDYGVALVDL